jgi:uncharacterized protein YkwD
MRKLIAVAGLAVLLVAGAPQQSVPSSSGLRGKLIDAINAGKLPGKSDATDTSFKDAGRSIEWADLDNVDLFKMLMAAGFKDDDLLAVAEWAWRAGMREEAGSALFRYVSADKKERQARADQTIARWRGDKVPEGGYSYDTRFGWEDAADRAFREAEGKGAAFCRIISTTNDLKALEKAFADLMVLYSAPSLEAEGKKLVKSDALDALGTAKEKRLKALEARAKSKGILNHLAGLKQELNRRREAALKAIRDPAVYFPESSPEWAKGDKVNGQDKVDQLVLKKHPGSVEELWEGAGAVVLTLDPAIKRDVDAITVINSRYLPQLGEKAPEDDLKAHQALVNNLNARIDLKTFSLDDKERDTYTWNRKVEAYNESLAEAGVTKEEKDHIRIINKYREMMGLKMMFIDARLCRATKKHSGACDAAGKIWHEGPDGNPTSRAKAEGFPEGVGENVAIGYAHPEDIWWRGWYRASDHHRNAIGEGWNCMGYGFTGRVGTQNFASTAAPKGISGK